MANSDAGVIRVCMLERKVVQACECLVLKFVALFATVDCGVRLAVLE